MPALNIAEQLHDPPEQLLPPLSSQQGTDEPGEVPPDPFSLVLLEQLERALADGDAPEKLFSVCPALQLRSLLIEPLLCGYTRRADMLARLREVAAAQASDATKHVAALGRETVQLPATLRADLLFVAAPASGPRGTLLVPRRDQELRLAGAKSLVDRPVSRAALVPTLQIASRLSVRLVEHPAPRACPHRARARHAGRRRGRRGGARGRGRAVRGGADARALGAPAAPVARGGRASPAPGTAAGAGAAAACGRARRVRGRRIIELLCEAVRGLRREGLVGEGVEGWEQRAALRLAEESALLRCVAAALACGCGDVPLGLAPALRLYLAAAAGAGAGSDATVVAELAGGVTRGAEGARGAGGGGRDRCGGAGGRGGGARA